MPMDRLLPHNFSYFLSGGAGQNLFFELTVLNVQNIGAYRHIGNDVAQVVSCHSHVGVIGSSPLNALACNIQCNNSSVDSVACIIIVVIMVAVVFYGLSF